MGGVSSIHPREPTFAPARATDLARALWLTYITIGWMTIEGAASLLLGWASKSLLLEAFGIDSVVELFSAGVLLWRLKVEASGRANETRVQAVEKRAARLVGYSLYALVAYVLFVMCAAFNPIGLVIRALAGRCGHCHRRISRALSFAGWPWSISPAVRFCPFCAASIDEPLTQTRNA